MAQDVLLSGTATASVSADASGPPSVLEAASGRSGNPINAVHDANAKHAATTKPRMTQKAPHMTIPKPLNPMLTEDADVFFFGAVKNTNVPAARAIPPAMNATV